MADDETFRFANERFYAAFAGGDADAMAALWAEAAPVLCVHPGAAPLTDRARIVASWRDILADPGVAEIRMDGARVHRHGGIALVVCYERLGDSVLTATNGFVLEDGSPRMVLHHAGACREAPPGTSHASPGGTALH
jgi:hypothetical protein